METIITAERPPLWGPLRDFFRRSGTLLLEPAAYFRTELPRFTLSEALAFGITNAWVAAVLSFFVQTINSFFLARVLERWIQKLMASEAGFSLFSIPADTFLYSAGALLLGPFFFLLRAAFSALGLYLFARLLIEDDPAAPEPVTYQGMLKIESAVLASQWFGIVPIFGGILSFAVAVVLTVTGIRERFGVSSRRAFAVVAAPYLVLFFFLLLMGALAVFALFQIPLQEYLDLDPSMLGG